MFILRLFLALIFVLVSFFFSEFIPDIPPFNHTLLRLIATFWFGLMGYGLFPDLARIVSVNTLSLFNSLAARVGIEVMNQMMRVQTPAVFSASYPSSGPIGGVSVNQ